MAPTTEVAYADEAIEALRDVRESLIAIKDYMNLFFTHDEHGNKFVSSIFTFWKNIILGMDGEIWFAISRCDGVLGEVGG